MGHLQFSAFDAVMRRLTQAWRRHEPEPVHSHAPVPSQLMLQVLDFGLATEDPLLLRAALSAFVDFIFFNRAQSGHLIALEDLRIENGTLVFKERRTKLKPNSDPKIRYRVWPSTGTPAVIDLLLRWTAVRDRAWADVAVPPRHFYTLPGERDPTARTVSAWFARLLRSLPAPPTCAPHRPLRSPRLAGGGRHCLLRAGGPRRAHSCLGRLAGRLHVAVH